MDKHDTTPLKNINLLNPWHLIAVGFGSGLIPKAPGTFGSIAAIPLLIQKQEITPAWELLQFCYALNPNDAAVNNYMGLFFEAFDKRDEASAYFRRAFELAPNTYWYQHALYLLQSKDKKQEKIAISCTTHLADHAMIM